MDKPWLSHYERRVPASLSYPERTLSQLLSETARRFPERAATIFFGARLTYRQLNDQVSRCAAGLQRMGVSKGDRVAILLPNCPQYVIAYYAALRAGAIVVPCNPLYVARELQHQLADSGAKVIFCLTRFYPTVKQARSGTALQQIIVTSIKEYFPPVLRVLFSILKEAKEGHRADLSGDATARWWQYFLATAPATPKTVDVGLEDPADENERGARDRVEAGHVGYQAIRVTHREAQIGFEGLMNPIWASGGAPPGLRPWDCGPRARRCSAQSRPETRR